MSAGETKQTALSDDRRADGGTSTDGAEGDVDGEQPALCGRLEVGHARNVRDVYGGRQRVDGELRHMGNTEPPREGWLGNPHPMDGDTLDERRRVIAAYLRDFLAKIETDESFRRAVEGLRGQRAACWCRGSHERRRPDNWCHLDVVACWLDGDLAPVYEYLRGGPE